MNTKLTPIAYHVINGNGQKIGTVVYQSTVKGCGWRYFPMYQAKASRKLWDTPEAAICNRVKFFTLEAKIPAQEIYSVTLSKAEGR
jgi:hypothetical protein